MSYKPDKGFDVERLPEGINKEALLNHPKLNDYIDTTYREMDGSKVVKDITQLTNPDNVVKDIKRSQKAIEEFRTDILKDAT